MEKYDENYEADWIITAISSGAEGAAVYKLHGNIDDLKQTILSFANSFPLTSSNFARRSDTFRFFFASPDTS